MWRKSFLIAGLESILACSSIRQVSLPKQTNSVQEQIVYDQLHLKATKVAEHIIKRMPHNGIEYEFIDGISELSFISEHIVSDHATITTPNQKYYVSVETINPKDVMGYKTTPEERLSFIAISTSDKDKLLYKEGLSLDPDSHKEFENRLDALLDFLSKN